MLRERNASHISGDLCDETIKSNKTQKHQLVRTTFSKLTTCDHCGRLLWGLVKQGLTCQTCGYVCHPSCIKEVVELKCTSKSLDDASLDSLLTPTIKSPELNPKSSHGELLGLDEEHSGLIHKLINGESRSVPVAKAATENATALGTSPTSPIPSAIHLSEDLPKEKGYTSLRANLKDHRKMMTALRRHASVDFGSGEAKDLTLPEPSPVTPSKLSLNNFVRDVMHTREKREKELERVRRNPSLNLMTTSMQNLTQFVPRITGVRIFRDNLVKIFTWENPRQTWTVFFVYVLVCLRPIWLIILPFIVMWILVVQDYLKTASETEVDCAKEKRHRSDKSKEPPSPAFSNFYPSAIGSDVAAAREMATKYTLNMQFMQNLMGTHVQVYEWNKKNWNDFKESYGPYWPLWVTVLGLPSSLVIYHLFSARTLFLLVGSYSLLGNNPYVMALAVNFSSLLVDELSSHLNLASLALKVRGITMSKFSSSPRTITISVFENQRWWAVLGWNDQTLSTERSSWTDETGKFDQTPIFQQQPEPGYVWEEDSNWQIVRDWCLPVQADEGGWVYYNNLWSGPSAKSQLNSFTRRRLWTRKMVSE